MDRVPLGRGDGFSRIAERDRDPGHFLGPCSCWNAREQRADIVPITFIAGAESQPDPLHLVLSESFFGPIVELGRPRALMRGHLLRVLECTAIGKVGGDPDFRS